MRIRNSHLINFHVQALSNSDVELQRVIICFCVLKFDRSVSAVRCCAERNKQKCLNEYTQHFYLFKDLFGYVNYIQCYIYDIDKYYINNNINTYSGTEVTCVFFNFYFTKSCARHTKSCARDTMSCARDN